MNNTDCLMCKTPFVNEEKDNGRYSLQDCGLSPAQFEGQDGFLCHSCKSKQMQQTRRASSKRSSSCLLEHPECLMCQTPFIKGPKGYSRVSLKALGMSPELFGGQDGFICYKCHPRALQPRAAQAKRKKDPKYIYPPSPVRRSQQHKCERGGRSFSPNWQNTRGRTYRKKLKEKVLSAIDNSKYEGIFRELFQSKTASKGSHRPLKKVVRKEIKAYRNPLFALPVTADHVANFNWDEVVDEASSRMPILVNVLKAALPDPSKQVKGRAFCGRLRRSTQEEYCIRNQRLGFILAVILYSQRPSKCHFIQGCISLQLWKHGCSQKVVECLNALGVCKGKGATARQQSNLTINPAQKQKQWQQALSKQLESSATAVGDSETREASLSNEVEAGVLNETHSPCTGDVDDDASDMSVSADDKSDSDAEPSQVVESVSAAANVDLPSTSSSKHDSFMEHTSQEKKDQAPKLKHMPPWHISLKLEEPERGYILVCDNVLMQSPKLTNELKLQASIFAVRNRVGFDQQMDYTMKHAEDIALSCFLPTFFDWRNLKQRMCRILEHILKDHLPFLKGVESSAPQRHQHSDALSKKSEIVSLGVIDENPFSTPGSVCILESLHQFVPSYGDENLYPIVCFGDGLSVEKMVDAKCAKASGASASDRLEGLVQCPQDFHRRGLLLQDTMDRFFKETSVKDRGTLFQLKQEFGHQSVKRNVMANFNHVEDLIEFCTRAFSIMLALKLAQLPDISTRPENCPSSGSTTSERIWLTKFIWEMIDFIWPEIPSKDIHKACEQQETGAALDFDGRYGDVENATNDDACKCGESTGEGMIRCFNNECGWFHYSCANVDGPVKGDWWCSAECRASKSYRYCNCHRKTGKERKMIQCELQSHCTSNEWYHLDCIGGAKDLPDEWYCSPECTQRALDRCASDGVLEYSRALLYEGLCHLAFRDAVREGDGPAILSHWRINTLQFWNNRHLKYVDLAHNMLAGVSGFYPARVAHDMTWNRVANVKGQADCNIGLDLVKEIPSAVYCEMLSEVQGVYPKDPRDQRRKLSDTLCGHLDDFFLKSKSGIQDEASEQKGQKFDQDIQCFAASYMDDGLFDFVPGRHHKSFPFFKHSLSVKSPETMGAKLIQLSQCMDMSRNSVQS